MQQNWGWHGKIGDLFDKFPENDILKSLQAHYVRCTGGQADSSQIKAWQDCLQILSAQLKLLVKQKPIAEAWNIVFEYELPRERGRRPDVVILAPATVIVIEFKGFSSIEKAHLDQVAAYARDLHHYHAGSRGYEVIPCLLLTKYSGPNLKTGRVYVWEASQLAEGIVAVVQESRTNQAPLQVMDWLNSDYDPLPSLVTAARTIFQNEPLPQIRRAQSAGIPQTIASLIGIAQRAQQNSERHLALVTGVPGAGKTLVGLQFVYENHLQQQVGSKSAVFLSGNGPLVKVLQHALRSPVFVQDVHGFLKTYGGNTTKTPIENIWIYDEAQRAWDAERVQEKRNHPTSEPEDFLNIGERKQDWAMMIGLIGEGQEIHLGEETGLVQWNAALQKMKHNWVVHCPEKIADVFKGTAVNTNASLDLNQSLRSHLAGDLHQWVKQLLNGEIVAAYQTASTIYAADFPMYVTRDLSKAKAYVSVRYQVEVDKRYGLLASSKAKNLSVYGVQNGYSFTKNLREGPWYNEPPNSRFSCCQLAEVATEFSCQGLELDFPVVAWGDDLRWSNDEWISPPAPRSKAKDPHQLRINSYRVLLTRGRDGFIVFVPPEPAMDSTWNILQSAGLHEL